MANSFLFLPDISGFTKFVQTTEINHSQHVIAELLELLLESNNLDLELAEVEGDALFLYKKDQVPTIEEVLVQAEDMFTAFYSHLKLLDRNRVCPCQACSTASSLQLKIIAHCGELQFITVQQTTKPFGPEVIEAHRLMKNSVESDQYLLLSKQLTTSQNFTQDLEHDLFNFAPGVDIYDTKSVPYLYSILDNTKLKLRPYSTAKKISFDRQPDVQVSKAFPISANELIEYITNYKYRHYWNEGVSEIIFNESEITRLNTEHVCVVKGKHLNFTTVTKPGKPNQIIYGEHTKDLAPLDEVYNFFIVTPQGNQNCLLEIEAFINTKNIFKKILIPLIIKRKFKSIVTHNLQLLHSFILQDKTA